MKDVFKLIGQIRSVSLNLQIRLMLDAIDFIGLFRLDRTLAMLDKYFY